VEFVGLSAYHKAVGEFHALRTSSPKFSRDNDLATFCTRLHDEPQHTIASPSHSQTIEQFVSERFTLCDSGKTAVLDFSGIEGDRVLRELEALLDEGGELADATALLAENLLCVRGPDDNIGDGGGDADLDARVTLLGELALEELVQLGVENTVCGGLLAISACLCEYPNS
jgi:hypothetical protein